MWRPTTAPGSRSRLEAHRCHGGGTFAAAVASAEPWEALLLVPAALAVCTGFVAYAAAVWPMTSKQRVQGLAAIANAPAAFTGKMPLRVPARACRDRRLRAALGLLGFPGLGWLFAGFPFTASILLLIGPPSPGRSFPPRSRRSGRDRSAASGWKVEFAWTAVYGVALGRRCSTAPSAGGACR